MRSFLVAVACLLFVAPAMAQTAHDAGVDCLDSSQWVGQSLGDHWANSFGQFLDTYHAELSGDQNLLLQQAIDLGSSRNVKVGTLASVHAMKGLMADVREAFTADQFSEILARMGSESQQLLAEIAVIDDKEIACACKTGASRGCPEGFPCTVGCTTWGTGEWNGLCVKATSTDLLPQ